MSSLEDISKETQKLIVSICIFIAGLISVFTGIALAPSDFAIPFCVVGGIGVVIGIISLMAFLIEWWD